MTGGITAHYAWRTMSSWTRRPVSALLALALLAGLGLVMVGESFFHTDDGCPVETHCLTCKWAAGSIAIVTPDLTQALALEPRGEVSAPPVVEASEAPRHRELYGDQDEKVNVLSGLTVRF